MMWRKWPSGQQYTAGFDIAGFSVERMADIEEWYNCHLNFWKAGSLSCLRSPNVQNVLLKSLHNIDGKTYFLEWQESQLGWGRSDVHALQGSAQTQLRSIMGGIRYHQCWPTPGSDCDCGFVTAENDGHEHATFVFSWVLFINNILRHAFILITREIELK